MYDNTLSILANTIEGKLAILGTKSLYESLELLKDGNLVPIIVEICQ